MHILLAGQKKATIGGTLTDEKNRAIVFSYDTPKQAWTYISANPPTTCPTGHPCTTPPGVKAVSKVVATTPVEMPDVPSGVSRMSN